MASYKILSEHYEGSPSVRSAPKIDAKDIKSGPGSPPTVGSFGHAASTVDFTKEGVVTRTANNRFVTTYKDYFRNGPVTQIDDYYFGRWIHAGTDNPPARHSIIPRMPDVAYITSVTPSRMEFSNPGDTPVNLHTRYGILNAVNPNRLGYFHSKLANFNQDLRNLMFDNANRLNYEATEWIDFLAKKGFSVNTTPNPGVVGLGIEVSEKNYAASHYPGKGYLIAYEKFQKIAKNLISEYGLSEPEAVEAMKRSIMLHEFGHVLGISGDKRSEKLQGELQAEFYSMMAEDYKGTKSERIYRALAREGEDYARSFSFSLRDLIIGESTEDAAELRQLEHKFLHEAIALGVRDIEGYVDMRLEETVGPILRGEPSYKSSRTKSKSSDSKKLEEMVDEKKEAEIEADFEPHSKIDESEFTSMDDVREREAKSEKESSQSETADDTMAEAA